MTKFHSSSYNTTFWSTRCTALSPVCPSPSQVSNFKTAISSIREQYQVWSKAQASQLFKKLGCILRLWLVRRRNFYNRQGEGMCKFPTQLVSANKVNTIRKNGRNSTPYQMRPYPPHSLHGIQITSPPCSCSSPARLSLAWPFRTRGVARLPVASQ